MEQKVKVEAEGRELVLKSSAGDYAIIPKNRRDEVLKMIEDKCYGCIDSVVASLPKTTKEGEKEASEKVEYAEDGLEVEGGEVEEEGLSFGEAFKRAREKLGAGQIFNWRGGAYTTDLASEASKGPQAEAEVEASEVEQDNYTGPSEEQMEGVVSDYEARESEEELPNLNLDRNTVAEVEEEEVTEEGQIVGEDSVAQEFAAEDSSLDEMSFGQAFRSKLNELGEGNTFDWRGNSYSTNLGKPEAGSETVENLDEEIAEEIGMAEDTTKEAAEAVIEEAERPEATQVNTMTPNLEQQEILPGLTGSAVKDGLRKNQGTGIDGEDFDVDPMFLDFDGRDRPTAENRVYQRPELIEAYTKKITEDKNMPLKDKVNNLRTRGYMDQVDKLLDKSLGDIAKKEGLDLETEEGKRLLQATKNYLIKNGMKTEEYIKEVLKRLIKNQK